MVDDLVELHLAHELHIFADPVKDDDRIVQRVADDRHDRADHLQVDLHGEAQLWKKAKMPRVMITSWTRPMTAPMRKLELEAEGDVDQDAEQGNAQADDGIVAHRIGELSAHHGPVIIEVIQLRRLTLSDPRFRGY